MSQWKSYANAAGMPKWSARILQQGSGNAAEAANNLALIANVSPGVWTDHADVAKNAQGIFPVTPGNKANTTGESAKVHGLGWALRTAGEGPITTFVAANGAGFLTGDTVTVSNGQGGNTAAIVVANSAGNVTSVAYPTGTLGPVFVNTACVSVLFNREQHVVNLSVANGVGCTLTGVGNANTINVTVSNTGLATGLAPGRKGVNAIGSFVSNSTGGFQNGVINAVAGIIWGANGGTFANNQANTQLVVTFTNANGTPVTNVGTGWTVVANISPSTTGNVAATALGGRAGRVTYEILTVDRHIVNGTSASFANTATLPQTF